MNEEDERSNVDYPYKRNISYLLKLDEDEVNMLSEMMFVFRADHRLKCIYIDSINNVRGIDAYVKYLMSYTVESLLKLLIIQVTDRDTSNHEIAVYRALIKKDYIPTNNSRYLEMAIFVESILSRDLKKFQDTLRTDYIPLFISTCLDNPSVDRDLFCMYIRTNSLLYNLREPVKISTVIVRCIGRQLGIKGVELLERIDVQHLQNPETLQAIYLSGIVSGTTLEEFYLGDTGLRAVYEQWASKCDV